ncbi:ABC transporter permease [Apilactobacillus sp. EABW-1NA]|uniref:ABC transporter permease n=1 Tax=Apilactobacillus sp. EABW-1NA TaxID=2984137 RepID=UPI0025AFFC8A|nr:ABC transporter permease [Apilactobacillus sp. EABW-1NA]MDN2613340.1 ABC transporter permease [Apilactobacillus sp. EABW-1NA]
MILASLINRNLKLYFSDRKRIIFSLMGALISVILYVVFLKNNIQKGWTNIDGGVKLLDYWLIGGTIAITAITTTGDALHQRIYDIESKRMDDLMMTNANKSVIDMSYVISATLIGLMMQVIVYIILSVLFMLMDQLPFNFAISGRLLGAMLIGSLVWTLFNMIVLMFVKKASVIPSLNAIISSSAGFFAGVYMPLGLLPSGASKILKYTPAPYDASLVRNILMDSQLRQSFQHVDSRVLNDFKSTMGLVINGLEKSIGDTLVCVSFIGVFLLAFVVLTRFRKNAK